MEKYNEILKLVTSLEEDFDKFYNKNNKAAGTRIRVEMQHIKAIAQDIRVEVTNRKNTEDSSTEKNSSSEKSKTGSKTVTSKKAK